MKLDEIVKLRPQLTEITFGPEPSLRELIERYYEPHFPEMYKQMAEDYLKELENMLTPAVTEIQVGDLVKVILDTKEGTPESFNNDGINIGDVGVVDGIDKRADYPVSVDFGNGKEIAFTEKELRKIHVEL